MKELLRKRIKEMTGLIGVSGQEWDVARYIKRELIEYVDDIKVLNNGIVIAHIKGEKTGPKIMVTAHMDEVGFMIKSIDSKGFLFFDRLGGATEACIPGRKVLVKGTKGVIPGVIGVRAGHLLTPEERSKPQTVQQSYIDICVSSKAEAEALGICVGSQAVPDSPCTEMHDPDYLITRAADCRALCAVIVETFKKLSKKDISGDIYGVFNILEETSTNAIGAAVNCIKPEYGLYLDTIPCGDVPDCNFEKELPVALKEGPVIILQHNSINTNLCVGSHPALIDALREISLAKNIKHQEIALNGAGYATDAVTGISAGEGMAVAVLACPRRYSHSPSEIIHLDDIAATQALVEEFLKNPVDINII